MISRRTQIVASALLIAVVYAMPGRAQGDADPFKLFEQGQNAHARGELPLALEFYEEALKLKPQFPEAEYQRGSVLVALNRLAEAEAACRRAVELKPEWSLPHRLLGHIYSRLGRTVDGVASLNRAIELDPKDVVALFYLSDLRFARKSSPAELRSLLDQFRIASAGNVSSAELWSRRGYLEETLGENSAALQSYSRAIEIDPRDVPALLGRATISAGSTGPTARQMALVDFGAALKLEPDKLQTRLRVAQGLSRLGREIEALNILEELDDIAKKRDDVSALRNTILANVGMEQESRSALEKLIAQQPRNAAILARLGALYRTEDPPRSMDYFRRAVEIEPANIDFAVGYGAALVQARRFSEAASLFRKLIAVAPDNYVAHANFALALYELKYYRQAIIEYNWILRTRPNAAVAHFFIATAYDALAEFESALAAYESFLAAANPQINQLEIDKVNLRLPSLRNQIRLGQGVKQKKPDK